ncbi:MAG: hypothetical protein HY235_15200 [Acidobacteria bacterium]|nr:hypothetical protein [Acidobacteriota bacterium]
MELLDRPWPEVASAAIRALKNNDLAALDRVDTAIRHLFLHEAGEGTEESRSAFILNLFEITSSREAKQVDEDVPARRFLTRWEHVAELTEAFRRDITAEEAARNLLRAREHGERLLQVVHSATPDGIRSTDLADELQLKTAYVSKLLREFEEYDLVERQRHGKNVWVTLGLVGRLLMERRPVEMRRKQRPPDSSRVHTYMDNPRARLAG